MKKLLFFLLSIFMLANLTGFAQTLNEGFEGTQFPPEDWTNINVSGSENWRTSSSYKHSGTTSLYVHYASAGHENYFITPKLTPAVGESLSFYVSSQQYSYTTLTVEVSTGSPIADDFSTVLETYSTGYSGTIGTTSLSNFVYKTIDLSAYVGQNIYIAFHVVDNNGPINKYVNIKISTYYISITKGLYAIS